VTSLGLRRRPPCRRSDRGQATVEFVVVVPVLILLMLAVVQLTVIGLDQMMVWHAARQAGRQAAVTPDPALVTRAAIDASPGLDGQRLQVELSGGTRSGDLVRVELIYQAATDVPLVGVLIDDQPLNAEVVFRVE